MKHIVGSDVNFRFSDSFQFMASSLEKLALYLDELKIVRSEFLHLSDDVFELLTKKGVFPYEYVDSFTKLDEKELPSREDFCSLLTDSHVPNEDYKHAKTVWRKEGGGCSDL